MYILSNPSRRYFIVPITQLSGNFLHVEDCGRPASIIIILAHHIPFLRGLVLLGGIPVF